MDLSERIFQAWVDLKSGDTIGPWSGTSIGLPRDIPTLPPPFLQTCSEVGEERDEFSPISRNKPAKGSTSLFKKIL